MKSRSILSGLLICSLSACGGMDRTTPGAQGPAASPPPSQAPSPAGAGYLHVSWGGEMVTYGIDGAGRLRPPVIQSWTKGRNLLASDPRGRFVFANDAPRGKMFSYAPNAEDGTLERLSEATGRGPCPGCSAPEGATRIFDLLSYNWGTANRHTTYVYVTAAVLAERDDAASATTTARSRLSPAALRLRSSRGNE
jgi:hypothetical protein